MKRVKVEAKSRLVLENIEGYLVREVKPFGNSARVDCPKEYLGRTVYLVVV